MCVLVAAPPTIKEDGEHTRRAHYLPGKSLGILAKELTQDLAFILRAGLLHGSQARCRKQHNEKPSEMMGDSNGQDEPVPEVALYMYAIQKLAGMK